MKSYDLRCPICGAVNRGLYLEETDGWMECEKCGNVTQSMEHRQTVLIPLILKTQSRSDNNKADRLAVGM
jgi:uncharacterized Zn finger protein